MADSLGTIRGQMVLDVRQALNAYTQARQAHVSTVTALNTGAGALTSIGAGLTAAGAGMAAGLFVAIDAAAKFEKTLDYFSAVSGATQQEYEAISAKALQLGADTQYSASEIAESFVELAKSGVDASGIINGIGEAVANLGSAADLPLADAAKSLTTILNTFGISAEESVAVVDKLAGAANSSSIDVQDLITTITYVGASAKVAGIQFADINTAIALLGERGIAGSKAGTGLRQMIDKLIAPTAAGATALKDLGIVAEDGTNSLLNLDGSLKPIPQLLDILNGSLAGLGTDEKVDLLGRIFPITSLPTILSLLDGGSAGMARLTAEIDKTTAAEIAGKRLDNLSGDIEVLKGNLDTLFIESGGGFQEFARGIIQGITDLVQAFIDLPDSTQGTILAIAAVIGVILIIIGFLGILAGSILSIIATVIIMGPVFAAMGAAIGAVGAAISGFFALLLANPIGLIIAGIVLLVAGLIWFFTQTEVGKEAWANFTQFLGEAWANIVAVATSIFTGLASFFSDVWTNIINFFNTAIATILNLFFTFHPLGIIIANWSQIIGFFVGLWTTITTGIASFVLGAISFFQNLPNMIVSYFTSLPGRIGYAIGFLLGTIVNIFITIGTWLATNVPLIINNVILFFQELPVKILVFLVQLYTDINTWFLNMAVQAVILITQLVDGVVTFFQELPVRMLAILVSIVLAVVTNFMQAKERATNLVNDLVNGVTGFFSSLPGMILGFMVSVLTAIVSNLSNARDRALDLAASILSGVVNGISGLPGAVTGIFNNVVNAIKGVIRSAISAVTSFASGIWEGFKDGLGIHSPSYIEHAMWAITGVIETETATMKKQVRVVQGLGNGISEVGNNIGMGFGSSMTQGITDLQAQIKTAKNLQASVAMDASFGKAGVGSEDPALSSIDETLKELKDRPQQVTYDIDSYNPVPEQDSESLPRKIRNMTSVLG